MLQRKEIEMEGLSRRTWELVRAIFPSEAEMVGTILVKQCSRNLPFCENENEYSLERVRFAALKISEGKLDRLQEAVDEANRDWRDELVWAGFANRLDAHTLWANELLGPHVKLAAHLFLEEFGAPYEPRSFPAETDKGAASVARALGLSERQVVKTVIFEADTGERVLVMLGGDQSAVSGNRKKATGSRDVRMAAPEAVKETAGCAVGSIPPFGWQPKGFRSFLERTLVDEPILGVGAGESGNEIMIQPRYLLHASKATIVNLVNPSAPVFRPVAGKIRRLSQ
jgi:Cys-tRNA(Pro)/Cys-tRNA(Cys) deacylase